MNMLDVNELRENLEAVKEKMKKRTADFNLDNFIVLDKKRKKIILELEEMRNSQNSVTRKIPELKKQGLDTTKILEEMKNLSNDIKILEPDLRNIDEEIRSFLFSIPNIPNSTVPFGKTDENNLEIRKWGEPRKFDFEPKPHWDIGLDLNIHDPEKAAKVTGSRFIFYKGLGAKLERALINFMLDIHTEKHNYTEIFPPFIVNRKSMEGTGQLPKFEDEAFKLEGTDYFLIPTAEVPVTNMYRDDILNGNDLPISHCAFSACFRSEAGSAGRDTRGLIRVHQFQKVELVKFVKPEDSYSELEKLTNDAEEILKLLNIPYRIVKLCGGDLGFSSAMTYDIEVWMPSYNRYVEISSCSNFEGFQARRANIRYKDSLQDKPKNIHTLNGSGLAIGRTHAAILENFQQEDGTVIVPEILIPYMNGITKLEKK